MRGKSLCVLLLEPRDELTPLCEVLRCVPYALLLGAWLVIRGEYPVSFLKPLMEDAVHDYYQQQPCARYGHLLYARPCARVRDRLV